MIITSNKSSVSIEQNNKIEGFKKGEGEGRGGGIKGENSKIRAIYRTTGAGREF